MKIKSRQYIASLSYRNGHLIQGHRRLTSRQVFSRSRAKSGTVSITSLCCKAANSTNFCKNSTQCLPNTTFYNLWATLVAAKKLFKVIPSKTGVKSTYFALELPSFSPKQVQSDR